MAERFAEIEQLYETGRLRHVGEMPPIGEIPEFMHGWGVRKAGPPETSFVPEILKSPSIEDLKPNEVIIMVMAAGLNPNGNWAAEGVPIDIVGAQKRRKNLNPGVYVGGSDASGFVWAKGDEVSNLELGQKVVAHCGNWDENSKEIREGLDPTLDRSFSIWGYEIPGGSFAQFTKVQAHQLLPKPPEMTFEESSVLMLDGATSYRMLTNWQGNTVGEGDPVLIWGGAGGLGSMAIQIVRELGGKPIAVVSSEEKAKFCMDLGAVGVIDRKKYGDLKDLPDLKDEEKYGEWVHRARAFEKEIWDILGERKNPSIIFEHPGEETVPTSTYLCAPGGMVVICAGSTGYEAKIDLRYLWMRQKRFQGSHFANDNDAAGFHKLVMDGKINPCLPPQNIFDFEDLPKAHQVLKEGRHSGKLAVRINAPSAGLK